MDLYQFLQYSYGRKLNLPESEKSYADFEKEILNYLISLNKQLLAIDAGIDELVDKKIKSVLESIYALLPKFIQHYSKTDSLTFGIVPKEDWVKEIDDKQSLSELKDTVSWKSFETAEDYISKLQAERKKQVRRDTSVGEIHHLLKKKVYECHPAITELPAQGFLELDFTLYEKSKEIVFLILEQMK